MWEILEVSTADFSPLLLREYYVVCEFNAGRNLTLTLGVMEIISPLMPLSLLRHPSV